MSFEVRFLGKDFATARMITNEFLRLFEVLSLMFSQRLLTCEAFIACGANIVRVVEFIVFFELLY